MSWIATDNHLAVFAAIMAIAGAAFLLERTRLGGHLTGAVIVILLAIAAANLGIIPHAAPTYDFIFNNMVPLLIPLFLFQADLKRLAREASRTSMAFIIAATGTVCGVVVAASLLDLSVLGSASELPPGNREAAIVGLFASTYIGGSVNYAALGEITGLSADASFFSAATAADNLFSALYLSLLALIPGWTWLSRRYSPHPAQAAEAETEAPAITAMSLCLAIAAAAVLVAITDTLVGVLNAENWRYVILSAFTLFVATALPGSRRWFAGAFELGVALSFAFFAAIAAGANIVAMIEVAPLLILLVGILLLVHAIVLFALGRVFHLTLPELITASNAAILGATTAPALAATKGWRDQVTPGILVGVLGYALGTFIGTVLYQIW
ncbi:conserved hypothetical protein [Luminiphilus syltensis NOR5-1B]|uniref:DUF819 family protein n=1 Tax=Luminiphilus syltensis NOR5-1B TaxID=565045 RepID=B8KQE7_9GAMM|nr:DUF819 family protein [Luminiphilus syltensis]EED34584.1 conserved hypothetical protein [Luminiphilus syltensis NOR5-1B]